VTKFFKKQPKINRTQVCIKIIFLILFLGLVPVVNAQEAYNLSVSPPTFEINANAGDDLENSIRVENLTGTDLVVNTEARNFTAVGEEGAVNLTQEESSFSLSSWIQIIPSSVSIPSHSSQIFKFKTKIPKNAEPGGHFGSIVFISGGSVMPNQTGAAVSQELATLVLVKVSGKTTEKATLLSFNSIKKFWECGPVTFENRIKNEGNLHVKPTGIITIKNMFGRKVATLNVDPKNVLPGAVRKNTTDWNRKYIFGRYTAVLTLGYGTQNRLLAATTHFYGFPYKIIGLILLMFVSLVYLLYRGRHRIKKAIKVLFSKENPPQHIE
jgi:hypothetical protein